MEVLQELACLVLQHSGRRIFATLAILTSEFRIALKLRVDIEMHVGSSTQMLLCCKDDNLPPSWIGLFHLFSHVATMNSKTLLMMDSKGRHMADVSIIQHDLKEVGLYGMHGGNKSVAGCLTQNWDVFTSEERDGNILFKKGGQGQGAYILAIYHAALLLA